MKLSSKMMFLLSISLPLCFTFLLLSGLIQGSHILKSSVQQRAASNNLNGYFSLFNGFSECNIRAEDLYAFPPRDELGFYQAHAFCSNREALLVALSGGGRIGFDAPYQPRGCSYRWFEPDEICFILERLDGLVFVGDASLQSIYNGLNILLRKDLAFGALDLSSADQDLREVCRCSNQFTRQNCQQHYATDSEQAKHENFGNAYLCDRTRHAFVAIDSIEPSPVAMDKFFRLVPKAPRSQFKPIPIVHSVGPASLTAVDAEKCLQKIVDAADESGRNTPILWVGPTAAGHIELKERKGNQEIWDFSRDMQKAAKKNDVDVLGLWNLTVQASSWDGMRFGEEIAITQAMLVINWLSRLETS